MIVIADTTPLNYLALINQSDLLPHLYGRVLIPQSVYEELQSEGTPVVVRTWAANHPVSGRCAGARPKMRNLLLARSPLDGNALFAKAMNQGLHADYTALVEKRYLASVSYVKNAGIIADKLLSNDPTYYDAYFATGVENYILGLNPAPVGWLFRLYGAQANKTQGIQNLRVTAAKGHYLLPFARLLLAVAALRDKNRDEARDLLAGLARDYPLNGLYKQELAKLQ